MDDGRNRGKEQGRKKAMKEHDTENVCQALGKLDYSETKIISVLSNHTESLNELKV